jgi:hypothetical protein
MYAYTDRAPTHIFGAVRWSDDTRGIQKHRTNSEHTANISDIKNRKQGYEYRAVPAGTYGFCIKTVPRILNTVPCSTPVGTGHTRKYQKYRPVPKNTGQNRTTSVFRP